jgi:hypothetical protein
MLNNLSRSISWFLLAGLMEIGGGYLMWLWLRERWAWWVGALSSPPRSESYFSRQNDELLGEQGNEQKTDVDCLYLYGGLDPLREHGLCGYQNHHYSGKGHDLWWLRHDRRAGV